MESAELERISALLGGVRTPEEVFGKLSGSRSEMLESARTVFRQLAKVVHPDLHQGTVDFAKAGTTFKKLSLLWEQAQIRIETGSYQSQDVASFEPFSIQTRKHAYHVQSLLARGDLCNLYLSTSVFAGKQAYCILKVPLKPEDNDLVSNEARILNYLCTCDGYEKLRHFVTQLIDTFSYQEESSGILRQVNVLSSIKGLYSLKEVREIYPQGIDPKDMAWIWRRLLIALNFAHDNRVVHGAVLPTHILLQPEQHGVALIDWSYAVLNPGETGVYISAISSDYRAWYPGEVFARKVATPGLDIYMAALCMIDLLGGDPQKRSMPETVPWQLQSYLKACTLPTPEQRPQDCYLLRKEFDGLIERLWGARKFRQFVMPGR